MDLEPFARINPCGMAGLEMTQLATLGVTGGVHAIAMKLAPFVRDALAIEWDGCWQGSGAEESPLSAQSATNTTPLSLRS